MTDITEDNRDDTLLLETLGEVLSDRHPATRQVGEWFAFGHLQGAARIASYTVCQLAVSMLLTTPDGPELTAGLRKLLEAKDCFVRAAIGKVL